MKINAYLNYDGNCTEALQFYEKHLGGKIEMSLTYDQQPEPKNIPAGAEKRIMYARIVIGETTLMASDGPAGRTEPMRSAYLALATDSSEQAERIFAALSDGGVVFMPMQETFFAHRFAMLRDKFGANWMILHERAPQGA